MAKKLWMQDAFKNAHGQLHKQLGVKGKIPANVLSKAANSNNPKLKKRAVLAQTARRFAGK